MSLETPLYGWYALTVSPPKSIVDKCTLHVKYSQIIVRFLRRVTKQYILYPELAARTARLHYHGLFHMTDTVAYYKGFHCLERIGFVKVDRLRTMKDKLRWIFYIRKDTPLTAGVLTPSPVPILPTKPTRTNSKWGAVCKTTLIDELLPRGSDDNHCVDGKYILDLT